MAIHCVFSAVVAFFNESIAVMSLLGMKLMQFNLEVFGLLVSPCKRLHLLRSVQCHFDEVVCAFPFGRRVWEFSIGLRSEAAIYQ